MLIENKALFFKTDENIVDFQKHQTKPSFKIFWYLGYTFGLIFLHIFQFLSAYFHVLSAYFGVYKCIF